MAAPRVVGGMNLELRIFISDPAQLGINVLHYAAGAFTGTGVAITAAATQLEGLFAPLYKPMLPSNVTFYGVGLRILDPVPQSLEFYSSTLRGVGTSGEANGVPKQSAPLITKRSDFAGRTGRGRFYCCFPNLGAATGTGAVAAAYATKMDAMGVGIAFTLGATDGGGTVQLIPCIRRRSTRAMTPITNCTSAHLFATMRKRGDYGRTNTLPF